MDMLLAFISMAARRPESEAGMDDKDHPARKRRPLTALARVQRRSRIFARLREGAAYDEIAEEERLSAERVRQIVREALAQRLPDEDADHAKLQLARLRPAMKIATEAIEGGDVAAIPSFLKALDRLTATRRPPRSTRSTTTTPARSCSRS